jgi:hypothetical protein
MVADGALYSPVRMAFRPSDSKFLTLQTGDVMTKATMCRQCGAIEIVGDVTKLRHLSADTGSAVAHGGKGAAGE